MVCHRHNSANDGSQNSHCHGENQAHARRGRSGAALVYITVMFAVLTMIGSLAVDYGRAQSARGSLQQVTDAAARAAAWGIVDNSYYTKAQGIASASQVDGTALNLQSGDVVKGNWNGSNFIANASPYNAVKVTATRSASRGTGIPTMFAAIMGRTTTDVHASAVATFASSQSNTNSVAGGSSVWYADLPNGTQIPDPWGYDLVDTLKPQQATGVSIVPGSVINFNASGSVTWSASGGTYNGPAGVPGYASTQAQTQYLNGLSDYHGPGGGLVAVFLDNTAPANQASPTAIDYTTNAAINNTTPAPQLRQVFFVGTGTGTNGLVNVTVPNGATRMMFGYADEWIWRDNAGSFSVTTTVQSYVKLVQSK